MKRHLLFLTILTLSFFGSEAQVDPLYAQYMMNPLLINPAYSGFTNNLNAAASYRKQWAGFDGSPSTFNANGHISLLNNGMGAGLIIMKDQIGNNNNTEVQATYAYKLNLKNRTLSFGLQAGMLNFRTDNNELNAYDPNDPAFLDNQNITKPSFGAGVILSSDKYFIGLAVPRMLKANTSVNDVKTELYSQHFYATASYLFYLTERVKFKPSVLLKGVNGSPLSVDYNVSATIDEKYTAGLFTRNFGTYGFIAQVNFNEGYRFGYALEVPSGKSVGTQFTTHEFMVGINLSLLGLHETGSQAF